MPDLDKIGFLYSMTQDSLRKQFQAFHEGLRAGGFHDGTTGKIEYLVAEDRYDVLRNHADSFVKDAKIKVIVAAGGPISALKAMEARDAPGVEASRRTVPIVFTPVANPTGYGLTQANNTTGTAGKTTELDEERLKLLKELNPAAKKIGFLVNPSRPSERGQTAHLEEVAKDDLGLIPVRIPVSQNTNQAIKDAFDQAEGENVDGVLVTADPFFNSRRKWVIKHANDTKTRKMPSIYQWREFVEEGGLIGYGPSLDDAFRRAGDYAARIFLGTATVAQLPIVSPDIANLKPVINLKTAEAQGQDIPLSLRIRSELING